jgi:phospholipid/cholesterol/gamma-HCH transport system substrate-binding protein
MNDRNLGFGVILFLILFTAVIAVYLSMTVLAPVQRRLIIFNSANSLNFLKKQDPVRLRGVEIGKIITIILKEGKTCVEIATKRPIGIYPGYQIIAEAKGLMGDRYIEINPGDMHKPAISLNEPLIGNFPLGPVEAITYTAELKTKVRSLIKLTDELRNCSSLNDPLEFRLMSMVKKIDSISFTLNKLLVKANLFAAKNADTLAAVMKKTDEVTAKMEKSAPEAFAALEKDLTKTRRLLSAVDSFVVMCSFLQERIKTLESGELSGDVSKLRQQIESLRHFINDLQEDGLRLPVNL